MSTGRGTTIVGLVLAAGRSARLGQAKQLASVGGRPMLEWVVRAAERTLAEVLVIVPPLPGPDIGAAVERRPGTRIVVARRAAEGQSASLRAGLAAAPPDAHGALILLADQPEVRAEAIAAVRDAAGRAPVVRATYRRRPGHPVLLAREIWPAVAELRGDQGARALVAADPSLLATVEVGGAPPADVDTEEDLRRLRARWQPRE